MWVQDRFGSIVEVGIDASLRPLPPTTDYICEKRTQPAAWTEAAKDERTDAVDRMSSTSDDEHLLKSSSKHQTH